MSNSSPLKGIERLSDELRTERQKANAALQERARFRLESEGLKMTVDNQAKEIANLQEALKKSFQKYEDLQQAHEELQTAQVGLHENVQLKVQALEQYEVEKSNVDGERESFLSTLSERESELRSLQMKVESLEIKMRSKDDVITNLKTDIDRSRNTLMNIEKSKIDLAEQLTQQKAIAEELRSQLQLNVIMENGYNDTKKSNEDLRVELENALNINSSLHQEVRGLYQSLTEETERRKSLDETVMTMTKEKHDMMNEISELEQAKEELASHKYAEMDAIEAARERAEAAVRGREFLDQQLVELREAHSDALQRNSELEIEATHFKSTISTLQSELMKTKERLLQIQAEVEDRGGVHAMVMEVDGLRAQLNEVRRQLVKKDMEEEAGLSVPQDMLLREQHSKQVYEGIINDLRGEVSTVNRRLQETSRRCEEALRRAAKAEQLEEEVEMYKEMAKNVSVESQSAAISASQAFERSIKESQEKHNLVHNVHQLESELHSEQINSQRLREEVSSMKERVKSFHSMKLAAEKKVAEVSAMNSRLEGTIEDLKQKADIANLQLEKTLRTSHSQSFTMSDLKIRASEIEALKSENSSLSNKLQQLRNTSSTREKELSLEVEGLKNQKDIIQRELKSLKEKHEIYRNNIKQLTNEMDKLRIDLETLSAERDRLLRDLRNIEEKYAEKQLRDLRKDLTETVSEWQIGEKEKNLKDRVIKDQQSQLIQEQEKVAQLNLQVRTLEERLRLVSQELSVFKGIDVYHSSMQMELQSYRKDKKENEIKVDRVFTQEKNSPESFLGKSLRVSQHSSSFRPDLTGNGRLTLSDMGVEEMDLDKGVSRDLNHAWQDSYKSMISTGAPTERMVQEGEYSTGMRGSDAHPPVPTDDFEETLEHSSSHSEEDDPMLNSYTYQSSNTPIPTSTFSGHKSLPVSTNKAASITAEERMEQLQKRAERQAIRDQQLRDRILKEATHSAGKKERGWDYPDTKSLPLVHRENQIRRSASKKPVEQRHTEDELSILSRGSASSRGTSRSIRPGPSDHGHEVERHVPSKNSGKGYVSSASQSLSRSYQERTKGDRGFLQTEGNSRSSYRIDKPQRNSSASSVFSKLSDTRDNKAGSGKDEGEKHGRSGSAFGSLRPAKSDFERARKLLAM